MGRRPAAGHPDTHDGTGDPRFVEKVQRDRHPVVQPSRPGTKDAGFESRPLGPAGDHFPQLGVVSGLEPDLGRAEVRQIPRRAAWAATARMALSVSDSARSRPLPTSGRSAGGCGTKIAPSIGIVHHSQSNPNPFVPEPADRNKHSFLLYGIMLPLTRRGHSMTTLFVQKIIASLLASAIWFSPCKGMRQMVS